MLRAKGMRRLNRVKMMRTSYVYVFLCPQYPPYSNCHKYRSMLDLKFVKKIVPAVRNLAHSIITTVWLSR